MSEQSKDEGVNCKKCDKWVCPLFPPIPTKRLDNPNSQPNTLYFCIKCGWIKLNCSSQCSSWLLERLFGFFYEVTIFLKLCEFFIISMEMLLNCTFQGSKSNTLGSDFTPGTPVFPTGTWHGYFKYNLQGIVSKQK